MTVSDVIGQDPGAIGPDVLTIVSTLVDELGGRPGDRPVGLDDRLDRDLGIGSLERVELLVRLEQRFGVHLPDAVVAEAVSPRDVVTAIRGAAPATREAPPRTPPPLGEAALPPVGARSLVDVLAWHAEATPDRVHVFLRDEDGRERPITYGALWRGARAIAAGLRDRRVGRCDNVAIMLRTEEAFFATFFGVLLAGGVRPVIPVTIRGAREILPADAWLPKPGAITVAVSAPITAEEDGWRAMVRLRDRTRAEIGRRSGEPAVNRSYTP